MTSSRLPQHTRMDFQLLQPVFQGPHLRPLLSLVILGRRKTSPLRFLLWSLPVSLRSLPAQSLPSTHPRLHSRPHRLGPVLAAQPRVFPRLIDHPPPFGPVRLTNWSPMDLGTCLLAISPPRLLLILLRCAAVIGFAFPLRSWTFITQRLIHIMLNTLCRTT
ncbi:unnamed protein product [Linum trigynum]|uniref:Uncharacterized protein n=1 Tax=Linum trigynum TaxID=586398 RepID=A0AAV2G8W7_9ROSI